MSGPDKEFFDEMVAGLGAGVCGRGMYDAAGAWGGTNPFGGPLRVLTHRLDDPPPAECGFRFVSGFDNALDQAIDAAGGGNVSLAGGADLIRQGLASGRVDELVLSTAPVILGAGKRLFDGFERDIDLEVVKVVSSPYATHVRYRVLR
jgi:dihydrofolate reductase